MPRFYASANPLKPGDPIPQVIVEADEEDDAKRWARDALGSGPDVLFNPQPHADVEIRRREDGRVVFRERRKDGSLGEWREWRHR